MTTTFIPETSLIGTVDFNTVAIAGTLGAPGIAPLPSVVIEQQLGQVIAGYATGAITTGATGWGEFIFLAIPVNIAITTGLVYNYQPSTYSVVVQPTSIASNAVVGFPLCVAINTVASNASSIQNTWFQVAGRTTILKDAVQVLPNVPLFVSGATAGRVKVLFSAGRCILGARSANVATVTSTTSTVLAYLNGSPVITAA